MTLHHHEVGDYPLQTPTGQSTHLTGSFLVNRYGERYLYSVNGSLFNQTGSGPYYRSFYGDALFKENTLYTIVGTDSGLLVKHILDNGPPPGSRYIFVEPSEILPLIERELPDLGTCITLCTPEEWSRNARDSALHEYAYLDRTEIVQSLAVVDANLPVYRKAWLKVEGDFNQSLWKFRAQFGTTAFIEKQLENVAENRVAASLLRDRFVGQTAVLLGGGPSLDDFLPWVAEHRSRLFVIAVSRISRRLVHAELVPDIIVSVDPHDISFDVSKEMLELSDHSLLVSANHVLPRLLGQWRGPKLYLDTRLPWTDNEDRGNIAGVGPTVGNTALSLAVQMGFKQVVLTGLDLCYSQEGFSHADGSNERMTGPLVSSATQTVVTNGGWVAETDNAFFNATQAFEQQAHWAGQKNCRLLNPSPGAARIPGVEFISLKEISLPEPDVPTTQQLTSLLPQETRDDRLAHYERSIRELRRFIHRVKKVRQLANNALQCNDILFGRNGSSPDFKAKLSMDRIERRLDHEFKDVSRLTKIFGMHQFVQTLQPQRSDGWSDEEVERLGRAYYDAYMHGANAILTVLQSANERLESRISEENTATDLAQTATQWRRDRQPGRIFIWHSRHPDRGLTDRESDIYDALRSDYQNALSETDTAHMRRSRAASRLTGAAAKAHQHLQNHDREGLARMSKALGLHSAAEALPLRALIAGYLAELDGRIDDAIDAYQHAEQGKPQEHALQRLVAIALDSHDFDSALIGLQALADLSPAYMPQLAHLHQLRGDVSRAINTYTDYLLMAPDDTATMMKLALLYHELNIDDGARTLLRHVVEKDPTNTSAAKLLEGITAA